MSSTITSSRRYCSVPGCGVRHGSMFLFPKQPQLREQWQSVCKIQREVSRSMAVCCRHFISSEVTLTRTGKRRLKSGAIPSEYLPLTLERKSRRNCIVNGCSKGFRDNVSLHYFPKDAKMRAIWSSACKMASDPSRNSRICSLHFREKDFTISMNRGKVLRSGAVPTLNLPSACVGQHSLTRSKQWTITCPCCSLNDGPNSINEMDFRETTSEDGERGHHQKYATAVRVQDAVPHMSSVEVNLKEVHIINKLLRDFVQLCMNSKSKLEQFRKLCGVLLENQDCACSPTCLSSRVICTSVSGFDKSTILRLVKSDSQLKALTGITFLQLKILTQLLLKILKEPLTNDLSMEGRIVLTLCMLRLNLSFECLSMMFGIGKHSCGKYFSSTIHLLAIALQPVIYCPSVKQNILDVSGDCSPSPPSDIVLDSVKIAVSDPNCLQCQISLHCCYLDRPDLKFLIGVAPSGLIMFVSKCYDDKASNEKIVEESELITGEVLGTSGTLIFNKELCIESFCRKNNIKINCTPIIKRKALSSNSALLKDTDFNVRLHVQKAINKMKVFKAFSANICWFLVPHVDDILTVIASLVNLTSPLISGEYFNSERDCAC